VSTPSGATPHLRIGYQEREAACAALAIHLGAGRLDAEEYGERYAMATMARTSGELDAIFWDLPAVHPAISEPSPGKPSSHVGWAAAATLAYWPLGIAAFIYSSKVDKAWNRGDLAAAARASRVVKRLGLIAVIMMGTLALIGIMAIALSVHPH